MFVFAGGGSGGQAHQAGAPHTAGPDPDGHQAGDGLAHRHQDEGHHPGLRAGDLVGAAEGLDGLVEAGVLGGQDEDDPCADTADPERGGHEAGLAEDALLGVPDPGGDPAQHSGQHAQGAQAQFEAQVTAAGRELAQVVHGGGGDQDDRQDEARGVQLAALDVAHDDQDQGQLHAVLGGVHGKSFPRGSLTGRHPAGGGGGGTGGQPVG
ncbi:hypothetical protein [Kitasatospora mediocidica]|uniref:hypothetical protein n=1 Tax=Kitasatospora mediocidica TaxID=58352 RepID=UPI0012FCE1A7|nr:hypothetical protein [Kitasatospora mediocidica]